MRSRGISEVHSPPVPPGVAVAIEPDSRSRPLTKAIVR